MSEKIIYGPLELPSGKIIKFREATGFDRVNVLSAQQNGGIKNPLVTQVVTDAYIAVKCITEIDGEAPQKNYKELYDDFTESDLDYYDSIRSQLFGLTKEKQEEIKDKADFLRSNAISTATSN